MLYNKIILFLDETMILMKYSEINNQRITGVKFILCILNGFRAIYDMMILIYGINYKE